MDELLAADQPLLHEHFAPGAKAIGQFYPGHVRGRFHGDVLFPECRDLVNRLTRDSPLEPIEPKFSSPSRARLKNHGIVHA